MFRGTSTLTRSGWVALVWCFTIGPAGADGIEFVTPTPEAAEHGVVAFIHWEREGGAGETWVYGRELGAVITRRLDSRGGDLTFAVRTQDSSEELVATVRGDGAVQFSVNGKAAAEVAPDPEGGWMHWGTESLVGSSAYRALLLATLEGSLGGSSAVALGYWACVAKILWCETQSAACIALVLGGASGCIPACTPVPGPQCLICLVGTAQVIEWLGVCQSAVTCWSEAYRNGCIPRLPW